MEDGLVQIKPLQSVMLIVVLILVVMEDGLVRSSCNALIS